MKISLLYIFLIISSEFVRAPPSQNVLTRLTGLIARNPKISKLLGGMFGSTLVVADLAMIIYEILQFVKDIKYKGRNL